jgi:hypothetical protein
MAIFLLLYVFFMLAWLIWSLILSSLLLKHRLPDNFGYVHLVIYWSVMAVIIVTSLVFIARADWVSLPPLFKSLSI